MRPDRQAAIRSLAGLGTVLALGLASTAFAAGELRIANSGEPDTLDPHHVSGTWENRIIGDMFMGLTTEAADGSVIPGAAESWEVSDDGTVYTFTLRDHTWSDGTPVTADDFVFAHAADPRPGGGGRVRLAALHDQERQAAERRRDRGHGPAGGARAWIPRRSRSRSRARPRTSSSSSPTTPPFRCPSTRSRSWATTGSSPSNIVGNGAYKVVEWLPNTHVKSEKNEAFYDADNVAIDTVYFYPSEERNAATKRFRAGEIDVQYDFASEQIDWLEENLPEATQIAPYLGIYYYVINTREPPFDVPALRQALAMAIDREAITDKVLRTGELPAYSFVPPGTGNYGEPAYVELEGHALPRSGSPRPRSCWPRPASARTIRSSSSCATTPPRPTRRWRSRSPPCGSSSASRPSCSTARSRSTTTTSRRATSRSRAPAGSPTTTTPRTSCT